MFLIHGKLTAKAGRTDEYADILLKASQLVSKAKDCKLYVIGKDEDDTSSVYVYEIWNSKEEHDNSLKVERVKELILKAMPILDGQPTKGQELEILGGEGM